MARIPTYHADTNVSDLDRIIGTDGDSKDLTTKNFFLGDIAEYVIDKFIHPEGSDYSIPCFTQGGTRITNSIISQDIAPLGGSITIAGNTTINKDLAVLGKSNLVEDVICSSNLDIVKELDVVGATTLRSSLVAQNAMFKEKVIMEKELEVYGDTNIYSPLIVHEQLWVRGVAEFEDSVKIDDQLTVNDTSDFKDSIFVEGNVRATGELVVAGVSTLEDTVSVSGDLNVLQNINVQNGDITLGNGGQVKEVNDPTAPQDAVTLNYLNNHTKFANLIVLNGLVNNIASQSGGYDYMEWVSNVTGPSQIPIFKTGNDLILRSVTWAFMGQQPLAIQPGEKIDFAIGVVKQGVSADITNYTELSSLFSLTAIDSGTFPHGMENDFKGKIAFFAGQHLAVVGTEAGTITPIDGELSISLTFEIVELQQ